ncbi:GTPase HflX, partial [Listeria monocytogenes]
TVISLLEELEMNHLPTLVIYNKMDHAPAAFVPDQPESLLISALDQEAPDTIKQRMIQLIEKNWAFFTIELSEEKGK